MSTETIFALATPPAKSGVAIIRLSGPRALPALRQLTAKQDWPPNIASLSVIRHPSSGAVIDRALALFFASPKSFTGEDVAELHIHGSLAVIREMLEALSHIDGLRPAEPGEFTKRAFLNGKMDLIEAEGLADLIAADTSEQKKQALRQMQGEVSHFYDELRTRMLTALAHLEAYIDFPEEEIPESVLHGLGEETNAIKSLINNILSDDRRGERLRDGIHIVILGAPNAGKSSLLNLLAKRDAAIVSHKAGTTRDVIEIHMDIAGFPVILMDTAGLRDTADDIEEEGVKRALSRAEGADLKLIVFDSSVSGMDEQSRGLIDNNSLIIINKIDIIPSPAGGGLGWGHSRSDGANNAPLPTSPLRGEGLYPISTKTHQGIDALLAAIEERITASFSSASAPVITRTRHRAQLTQALTHLERIDWRAPLELTCEELRLAAQSVGKITGKIAVDDVLGVIFSEFCIGK